MYLTHTHLKQIRTIQSKSKSVNHFVTLSFAHFFARSLIRLLILSLAVHSDNSFILPHPFSPSHKLTRSVIHYTLFAHLFSQSPALLLTYSLIRSLTHIIHSFVRSFICPLVRLLIFCSFNHVLLRSPLLIRSHNSFTRSLTQSPLSLTYFFKHLIFTSLIRSHNSPIH